MDKKYMKIAIIGAGPAGLACALQCEKLGVITDLFDSDSGVGWNWPSVILLLNVFEVPMGGDIRDYLRDNFKLDLQPLSNIDKLILKSPHEKAVIKGNLGYFYPRGKHENSLENQLRRLLKTTAIHLNRPADYRELSKKYDYVVVATGNEAVAKNLGVWQEYGTVYIHSGLAAGEFDIRTQSVYFNTAYAKQGYGRLTPISNYQAVVDLYGIGMDPWEMDKKFQQFLETEGLSDLQMTFRMILPPFSTGKIKKFQVDNIFLVGRAAGLTERLTGTGCVAALSSGFLAAEAMIKEKSYADLVKPLQEHIENISSFRKIYEKLNNEGLDKMVKLSSNPLIKFPLYNSPVSFMDILGSALKRVVD
ncbi:FAD-dependent oxidoreductase [Desulforamulus ruminis]|uniref:FAD-dependent oxidoreductase n=1 Tax=Desulforamulus ruminis TaxID=1564 RepID=UPI0023531172|nr:FAD-dependent oxidoreductase [Desulforamulus ruminis]